MGKQAEMDPGTMLWILALGGVGIVVGLATYGYKIMNAMGVKLIAITPSRGSCIELGAALVVIYGTGQGWPLSTTHCQIGATVAVGLFEGCQGVNKEFLASLRRLGHDARRRGLHDGHVGRALAGAAQERVLQGLEPLEPRRSGAPPPHYPPQGCNNSYRNVK